ncbi:MAG: DsbE family thiol:disulfide interchange protein [Dokdonella sp.]|uniref:DsbE family thiol:disulfide interchange protein n=1 Tax=Dokdonella sp. TaxID=2291710 RepID=UPI0025C1279D|nr:DsbE family thiol:disulfide interchange protein [Dokdonella sp.]MBX3699717.1 DsbE family thiol:disulfide interchange protein [Dokdonella sp.]MCW5579230.1 DsbE family thiol:disulfide interchange protein [Dokdonella sp.]
MNARVLPLLGFGLLVVLLGFGIWWSSTHDLREVPSPLIDKPAPTFTLPELDDPSKMLGSRDLAGQPYLLNVFASWCFACRDEHPILMREGKRLGIRLVGFNYKDEPGDAKRWLAQYGNPYDVVIADLPGKVAIDFGVTGAPESFLVDGKGIIRFKYISPITPEVIERELLPRIAAMKEAAR